MPSININLVIVDGVGGSVKLNGVLDDSTGEVELGSEVTFTATPEEGYGFMSYAINGGNTVYVPSATDLSAEFTSPKITINDDLLGNVTNKENHSITIELRFEELVTVDVNMDETETGAIAHEIITKYNNNQVAHVYEDNKLTVFKNSTIILDTTANKVGNQYYVVNEIVIGDSSTIVNQTEKSIIQDVSGLVDEGGNVNSISIKAAKVYKADDRAVTDGAVTVATISVDVENTYNAVTIKDEGETPSRYIVENAKVYYNIIESNTDYDFLGMKVDGVVTLKEQLTADEWSYDSSTKTRTWEQEYSQNISTAEPVMLYKWYTVGNESGRTVEVSVDSTINATLKNTDIDYSYALINNIFGDGDSPLYAGDWKVLVGSTTAKTYTVSVKVYKGSSYVEYGENETFTVDSSVTRVVIAIADTTAVTTE